MSKLRKKLTNKKGVDNAKNNRKKSIWAAEKTVKSIKWEKNKPKSVKTRKLLKYIF